MMGRTHALSGGVAWVGVMVPVDHYVHHLTPAGAGLGLAISTGAAMLPDLDHPNSTIANTYGVVTKKLCEGIAAISGGHRKATHSFLGTAAFTGIAALMTSTLWTAALLTWLCLGMGVRALWKRPRNRRNGRFDYGDVAGLVNAAVAAVLALALVFTAHDHVVPVIAVAVGYLTHLVGDTLTKQGVNWMWPNMYRVKLTTMRTGGPGEKAFVVLLYATLVGESLYLMKNAT